MGLNLIKPQCSEFLMLLMSNECLVENIFKIGDSGFPFILATPSRGLHFCNLKVEHSNFFLISWITNISV